jgi:hypothetical protein
LSPRYGALGGAPRRGAGRADENRVRRSVQRALGLGACCRAPAGAARRIRVVATLNTVLTEVAAPSAATRWR